MLRGQHRSAYAPPEREGMQAVRRWSRDGKRITGLAVHHLGQVVWQQQIQIGTSLLVIGFGVFLLVNRRHPRGLARIRRRRMVVRVYLGWLAALMGEKLPGKSIGAFSPAFCWTVIPSSMCMGECLFHASCHRELIKRGIAGMLIIKALVVGSALMLLASCAGYLTNYQTPCVQGHVCECVQYTTVNRSWLDCRDYGRVKSKAY
jgi:hypothetical protein